MPQQVHRVDDLKIAELIFTAEAEVRFAQHLVSCDSRSNN